MGFCLCMGGAGWKGLMIRAGKLAECEPSFISVDLHEDQFIT